MEKFKLDNPEAQATFFHMSQKVYDMIWQMSIAKTLLVDDLQEDCSNLTASEIMQKIHDFLKQSPPDIYIIIFLNYLSTYPVSMCKREVSPMLKFLIGFHYRIGEPTKTEEENGAKKVSFDELATIFCRSKATVSACIEATQQRWQAFKAELEQEKEIELEAKKQLIEERKQKMNEEEQRNRRT